MLTAGRPAPATSRQFPYLTLMPTLRGGSFYSHLMHKGTKSQGDDATCQGSGGLAPEPPFCATLRKVAEAQAEPRLCLHLQPGRAKRCGLGAWAHLMQTQHLFHHAGCHLNWDTGEGLLKSMGEKALLRSRVGGRGKSESTEFGN